jgi:thymidylate synthase
MSVDAVYQNLIRRLLTSGERVRTRNGNCRRLLWERLTFSATPLIALRRTAWRNCLREWEWFMSGSSFIQELHPTVRHWWQPWADDNGEVLFNYSHQLRAFQGNRRQIDQVGFLLQGVREHPFSRRNCATTWNAAEMADPDCPITNCHGSWIQLAVDTENRLHLRTFQRSVDVVCGLPHNWLQYWGFLLWLAHHGGRQVGSLVWEGGDNHLYQQHEELACRLLAVDLKELSPTPALVYDREANENFRADDFSLSAVYAPVLEDRAEMVV